MLLSKMAQPPEILAEMFLGEKALGPHPSSTELRGFCRQVRRAEWGFVIAQNCLLSGASHKRAGGLAQCNALFLPTSCQVI